MFERFKVAKRLGELEERQEKLERDFKRLELEWEDTYDRVKRLFHRVAKRAQRMEGPDAGDSEAAGDLGPPAVAGLDERRSKLQEQILARRGKLSTIKQ